MAITPFTDIPKRSFLIRMIGPSLGIFIFFFLVVGVVANSPEFHKPQGPVEVIPFWQAAFRHYNLVFSQVFHIPEVCLLGSAVNDFQANQCSNYWSELFKSAGLALCPLIAVGIFLLIGLDNLKATYKRAQKKYDKKVGMQGGTVTNPPDAPSDFYSWFFCFRAMMVELPNKKQIKVYVPVEAPPPRPGDKLVVIDMGSEFGEVRFVAILYAPHVAVVRG